MAKEIYSLSLDSIKLLCGLIRDLASVSDGILDTAICTDKTFSSYYIDLLLKQLKADSEAYTDEVASALTKLTAEVVTVEPTLDNTTDKINTILLYSPGGNDVYDQYLRLETQLISLGSTQISMADYIKTSEADNKYSTKTELKAVTDKIGTTTLTTTATTLTGAIEEVKGIAEQGAMLTVTKTQYDQLVAGQTVNIDGKDYTYDDNTYYVVKDDGDTITTTSTIDSTSTDSEVPTAKVVYDNAIKNKSLKTYTSLSQLGLSTPTTVGEIFNAIPDDGSLAVIKCGELANSVTDVPNSFGLLTIEKGGDSRFSILFKHSLNGSAAPNLLYTGQLKGSDGSGLTWNRVCTTKVKDVPVTKINIINGIVNPFCSYQVINGVCYIQLNGGTYSLGGAVNGLQLATGLPIPASGQVANTYVPWSSGDASKQVILFVDGTGNLMLHAGAGANGCPVFTSFSYPVKES